MQHKPKMTESRYWIIMSIQDNHGDLNEVMMTDHVWWQRHTCARARRDVLMPPVHVPRYTYPCTRLPADWTFWRILMFNYMVFDNTIVPIEETP